MSRRGPGTAIAPHTTVDPTATRSITVFLAGDVMTGRGVDQVLPHPSDPRLYEPMVRDARDYVRLAESANGPVPAPVAFDYVWGSALAELERLAPDARIINLETSVTTSDRPEPKGINYRMHPANVPCLVAARIDCCVLANNHVLDWGQRGLLDTLDMLEAAGLKTAGAGRNLEQAEAPAVIDVGGKARILVFAFGCTSSGIPPTWGATRTRPGIHLLRDLSTRTAEEIAALARAYRRSQTGGTTPPMSRARRAPGASWRGPEVADDARGGKTCTAMNNPCTRMALFWSLRRQAALRRSGRPRAAHDRMT